MRWTHRAQRKVSVCWCQYIFLKSIFCPWPRAFGRHKNCRSIMLADVSVRKSPSGLWQSPRSWFPEPNCLLVEFVAARINEEYLLEFLTWEHSPGFSSSIFLLNSSVIPSPTTSAFCLNINYFPVRLVKLRRLKMSRSVIF